MSEVQHLDSAVCQAIIAESPAGQLIARMRSFGQESWVEAFLAFTLRDVTTTNPWYNHFDSCVRDLETASAEALAAVSITVRKGESIVLPLRK